MSAAARRHVTRTYAGSRKRQSIRPSGGGGGGGGGGEGATEGFPCPTLSRITAAPDSAAAGRGGALMRSDDPGTPPAIYFLGDPDSRTAWVDRGKFYVLRLHLVVLGVYDCLSQ